MPPCLITYISEDGALEKPEYYYGEEELYMCNDAARAAAGLPPLEDPVDESDRSPSPDVQLIEGNRQRSPAQPAPQPAPAPTSVSVLAPAARRQPVDVPAPVPAAAPATEVADSEEPAGT